METKTLGQTVGGDEVRMLVDSYAVRPGLTWSFVTSLPGAVSGEYVLGQNELRISTRKTGASRRWQVETILHEIEHFNQDVGDTDLRTLYAKESRAHGYWDNAYEVGARAFAAQHLDEALRKLDETKPAADIYDVVEELVEEFADAGRVTRLQIGKSLQAFELNTAANMARVLDELRVLGLEVGSH